MVKLMPLCVSIHSAILRLVSIITGEVESFINLRLHKLKIWWASSTPFVTGHMSAHNALIQHIMLVYDTNTHNSHFLFVCTVANCRQHRAAENRLRHTVLHENPSFPWADPSLFCINANYIILSGMQIRLDEAMADHLYHLVSVLLPNPQKWNILGHWIFRHLNI